MRSNSVRRHDYNSSTLLEQLAKVRATQVNYSTTFTLFLFCVDYSSTIALGSVFGVSLEFALLETGPGDLPGTN